VLKVPPSPALSARKMMKAYLTVTIIVIDQMIKESAPTKSMWLGGDEKVDE
jgi:hypothetical protein